MRIISQNGDINLPYEMTALFAYDNRVEAVFAGGIQKSPYVMAMYENKEKCQKAMQKLVQASHGWNSDFQLPEDDDV